MAKSKKTGSSPAKGKGSASKGRGGMSAKGKTASRRPDNRSAQEFSPDFYFVTPHGDNQFIPVSLPPDWKNPPNTPFPIKMPAIPGSPIPSIPTLVPIPNPNYDPKKPTSIPAGPRPPYRPKPNAIPPGYYGPGGTWNPLRRRGK